MSFFATDRSFTSGPENEGKGPSETDGKGPENEGNAGLRRRKGNSTPHATLASGTKQREESSSPENLGKVEEENEYDNILGKSDEFHVGNLALQRLRSNLSEMVETLQMAFSENCGYFTSGEGASSRMFVPAYIWDTHEGEADEDEMLKKSEEHPCRYLKQQTRVTMVPLHPNPFILAKPHRKFFFLLASSIALIVDFILLMLQLLGGYMLPIMLRAGWVDKGRRSIMKVWGVLVKLSDSPSEILKNDMEEFLSECGVRGMYIAILEHCKFEILQVLTLLSQRPFLEEALDWDNIEEKTNEMRGVAGTPPASDGVCSSGKEAKGEKDTIEEMSNMGSFAEDFAEGGELQTVSIRMLTRSKPIEK